MRLMKRHDRLNVESGQSLVEYTLIVTLVILAFGFALAATGPAIGNVFSNTIFNLVGQDGEVIDIPDRAGFWGTVTWVAQQTPQETPLATRTTVPPTQTNTPGPSPTPTQTTVPATPTNTPTPAPSPTPFDRGFVAPWTDSANPDTFVNWRLDNVNSYFGSGDWFGSYFPSIDFTGTPFANGENKNVIDPSAYQILNQNYGAGSPAAGGPTNNFSIRWRRNILLASETTLSFDVTSVQNGGVRVFIVGGPFGGDPSQTTGSPGTCSQVVRRGGSAGQFVRSNDPMRTTDLSTVAGTTSSNQVNRSNGFHVIDDGEIAAGRASQFECLVIDRWRTGDSTSRSIFGVQRTVPAGEYTIIVEYAHTTGDARIGVNVTNRQGRINPDDTAINSSGNPISGSFANCNFTNMETTRSDTPSFMWKEFSTNLGVGFPGLMRCYLELRGYVEVPASMTDPKFTFWDAWDIRNNVDQWVEIADYDPDNDGIFRRQDLVWQRVFLHRNNTFNYNWTYNVIDLAPYLATSTSRRLAIRFGMERREAGSDRMLWYIDSMTIDNMPSQTLYMNKSWDLNSMDQLKDFIVSGNWNLTSELTVGGGMSFHESPTGNTNRMDTNRGGNSSVADGDQRMHTIEFNGFIDLDDPRGLTDDEGDQGDPILTFFHRYNIGARTGLEVQYTTAPYGVGGATWTLVPNGGQIVARTTSSDQNLNSFEQVVVNLNDVPARRFRLRLAMVVRADAPQRAGWWIDNIKLERSGRIRYLNYPFIDDAENPAAILDNYNLLGAWGRVVGGHRPPVNEAGWSYTDSPEANFDPRVGDYSITFRKTLDLYNDSPQNVYSPACDLGALCETPQNPTPVNPVLSFWHKRYMTTNTQLAVDWKRTTEPQSQWRPLWVYNANANQSYVVSTSGGQSTDTARTRVNDAWERVQVDLAPVFARLLADNPNSRTDSDPMDDDIVLRIRFSVTSNPGTPSDGVYIDDIRIDEREEPFWALWPTGETRNNIAGQVIRTNGTPVVGNGTTYQDTLDNRPWFNIWHVGGGWDAVSFEQRDGLLAFHDSTTVVNQPGNRAPNFDVPEGNNGVVRTQTFNVLEMKTIIDLRGTLASDRPLLYFWTRHYAGSDREFLSVQISREDPTNSQNACPNPQSPVAGITQCYQKEHGWRRWETVWSTTNSRNYTWTRAQIDLSPYAQSAGQDGTRIRIRFVTDALRTSPAGDHRDGWYIDNLTFTYFDPQVTFIGRTIGGAFTDNTRSMDNWVAEGGWGLTPAIWKGAGGGVTSLGGNPWQFQIWRRAEVQAVTPSCGDWRDCTNRFLNNHRTVAPPTPWHSGFVSDIRENWGSGGPRNASNVQVTNEFVIRWEMTTPATLIANRYIFITAADDGVRLRYDTVPPGNLPPATSDDPPAYSGFWNIVDNWQYQGRTTTVSSARIEGGVSYRFTMEYFESWGDASVQLTIGTFSFSMAAQTPRGSGRLESEQVPIMRNSNSSLIYRGVFDLTAAVNPVLAFSTYYELGGTAHVEVSIDGGFTWTTQNLQGAANPEGIWAGPWWGYYWNNSSTANPGDNNNTLDFPHGGWPNPAPTFATQPVTFRGPTGFPKTRNEGNVINYSWGGSPNGGTVTGINNDYWSARFVRRLATTDFTTLTFTIRGDDGFRLWVNYEPGCALVDNDPNRPVISGGRNWGRRNTQFGDPNAGCLIIDDWENQDQTRTVTRTVPPGAVIMIDHYEFTGNARMEVTVRQGNFSSPSWSGTYTPDFTTNPQTGWQNRIYDLSAYAGPGRPPIMLRFRVDRLGETSTSVDSNTRNGNNFNWPVGLWLADINVFEP